MKKASRQVSEIDRLIELASDEKSPTAMIAGASPRPEESQTLALSLEDKKDPRPSMWRVLLQLRPLLPHLARMLPLLERGLLGTNISGSIGVGSGPDSSHFDRGVAGVEASHRDLNAQLKTQTGEIKYLQEQMTWLSKSLEKQALQQEEISTAVLSLKKLIQVWAIVATVLLGCLVGLAVFLVLSRPT